jgi:hypothetical protein
MIKRLIAALLLCISLTFFTFPGTAVAQDTNTIILDFGSASKDDIKDLRYGEGKLFQKIAKVIARLKDSGDISESAQPVIAIFKQKKEGSFDF